MLAMLSILALLMVFSPTGYGINRIFPEPLSYDKIFLSALGFALVMALCIFFGSASNSFWVIARFSCPIFACFITLLSANKHYFAFKYFLPVGAMLNCIAVAINGWRMPVIISGDPSFAEYALSGSATHALAGPSTKLPWIADRFYNDLIAKDYIVSIGDILMMLAVIYTAGQLSMDSGNKPAPKPRSL